MSRHRGRPVSEDLWRGVPWLHFFPCNGQIRSLAYLSRCRVPRPPRDVPRPCFRPEPIPFGLAAGARVGDWTSSEGKQR